MDFSLVKWLYKAKLCQKVDCILLFIVNYTYIVKSGKNLNSFVRFPDVQKTLCLSGIMITERVIDVLLVSFSHHPTCYRWLTPQTWMLCSMEVHSTQRREIFIFTIGIQVQNLVCTISGPFRISSLSMAKSGTWYPEERNFSWSDSWLGRTLPIAKLSSWYTQGRSTDYFRLDQERQLGFFFLLALRTCWDRKSVV